MIDERTLYSLIGSASTYDDDGEGGADDRPGVGTAVGTPSTTTTTSSSSCVGSDADDGDGDGGPPPPSPPAAMGFGAYVPPVGFGASTIDDGIDVGPMVGGDDGVVDGESIGGVVDGGGDDDGARKGGVFFNDENDSRGGGGGGGPKLEVEQGGG